MYELTDQELEQVVGGSIPSIPVLEPAPGLPTGDRNRNWEVLPRQATMNTCALPLLGPWAFIPASMEC